jgi:hypothetical protein
MFDIVLIPLFIMYIGLSPTYEHNPLSTVLVVLSRVEKSAYLELGDRDGGSGARRQGFGAIMEGREKGVRIDWQRERLGAKWDS